MKSFKINTSLYFADYNNALAGMKRESGVG